jgi:L,D-peptidoglycan transpeptidase YkuD (ErfK/YbiS/YcfS/YnhG family)
LFKKDSSYNYLIPINYNTKKPLRGKGSAIFLHLTKDYKPTAGCIALKKNDFLILLKLITKKTKIKII